MSKYIPKVKKLNLIFTASLVWLIASLNVINLGFRVLKYKPELFNLCVGAVVFAIFYNLIFSKMIVKHTKRILGYENEVIEIYKFFDKKTYLIMIFMISLGITLRKLKIIPVPWLGGLYFGIGTALMVTAIGFMIKYFKLKKEAI